MQWSTSALLKSALQFFQSATATGATVFQSMSSLQRTKTPLWKGIESWCLDRILEEQPLLCILLLFQGCFFGYFFIIALSYNLHVQDDMVYT